MSSRLNNLKNLVGYWPLNNHAEDLVGGNHGTWSGTEGYADGPQGRAAASFDGSADYIDCGDQDVFDLTTAISISAWIKKEGNSTGVSTSGTIVGKELDSSKGYVLEIGDSDNANPNQFRWYKFGLSDASHTSFASVADNVWAHIVAVYDGANSFIYSDGELESSEAATGSITTNTDALRIGHAKLSGGKDNYFNGRISDVRLYNVALTDDEVRSLFRRQPPRG